MNTAAFPKPPDYPSLKEKLSLAISSQGGRDNFLGRAKMSSTTLTALLGPKEKLPWKVYPWGADPKAISTRQLRAWARTFARIAAVVGDESNIWMEGYDLFDGLPEEIIAVVRSAANETKGERLMSSPGEFRESQSKTEIKIEEKKEVCVGIVEMQPLAGGGDPAKTFFGEIADRVVGSINPDWTIKPSFEPDIDKLIERLQNSNPYDMAVGVFDMVCRRKFGLDFVHLPGWRLRLSGIYLQPQGNNSECKPTWNEIVSKENRDNHVAVVVGGEAGYLYLKGQCRYEEDHLKTIWATDDPQITVDPQKLGEQYVKEFSNNPKKIVVFVADEETCRRVQDYLNGGRRPTIRGNEAFQLEGDPDDRPSYRLSIAVRDDDPRWRSLIAGAVRTELFDNVINETVRLYAKYLSNCMVLTNGTGHVKSSFRFDSHDRDLSLEFLKRLRNELKCSMTEDKITELLGKGVDSNQNGNT